MTDLASQRALTRSAPNLPLSWYFDPRILEVEKKLLFARGSDFAASMLRDIEGGHRVEADHILGDMLKRARAAGVDPGPLRIAYAHLQAYQAKRKREGAA